MVCKTVMNTARWWQNNQNDDCTATPKEKYSDCHTDHKNDVIKYQIMQVRTKTETSKLVLYSESRESGQ